MKQIGAKRIPVIVRTIFCLQLLQVSHLPQVEGSSMINSFWRVIQFHTSSSSDMINESPLPVSSNNNTPSQLSPIEQDVSSPSVDDCPIISADAICAQYWDPYNCTIDTGTSTTIGNDYICQYYNECAAIGAGYNISNDCIHIATQFPTSSPIGVVESSSCPQIADDVFCEESWKPLLCGINKECQYNNDCYAWNSGYNVTSDCKFI